MLNNLVRGELTSFNELTSAGKSGSFFYYSADGKYILKTISKKEFSVLLGMLPMYYEHLKKYPGSLLCRVFGLHKICFEGMNRMVEFDD